MNGTCRLVPMFALMFASLGLAALACAPSTSSGVATAATRPAVTADAEPAAAMPQISKTAVETIEGQLREVLPAGHYTYLRLDAADAGETWAVVLGAVEAKVGQPLVLAVHGTKSDFHSRRLDRNFPELFFARITSTG